MRRARAGELPAVVIATPERRTIMTLSLAAFSPAPASITGSAPAAAAATSVVDLASVKTRQRGAWSSGDYSVVGTTLQIVGEELCEAMDIRAGQRVLDVAAGNGNVALAAARRWCEVVA